MRNRFFCSVRIGPSEERNDLKGRNVIGWTFAHMSCDHILKVLGYFGLEVAHESIADTVNFAFLYCHNACPIFLIVRLLGGFLLQ